jgi:hypothetical protein
VSKKESEGNEAEEWMWNEEFNTFIAAKALKASLKPHFHGEGR